MITIQNWLKDIANVTDEELDFITEITETVSLKANEVILKQGQVSNKMGLLLQGSTRTYFTDTEGNEKVVAFAFEGQPLIVLDSFMNQTPSSISSETMEPCVIIGTDYKRFSSFINKFPRYNTVLINALTQWFAEGKDRMEYLNKNSAKERYESMCKLHPKIIERVPLMYIASYLGITQHTLSRIRAKK
jgi:CRP-like cAMP-binding protein